MKLSKQKTLGLTPARLAFAVWRGGQRRGALAAADRNRVESDLIPVFAIVFDIHKQIERPWAKRAAAPDNLAPPSPENLVKAALDNPAQVIKGSKGSKSSESSQGVSV